MRKIKCSNRLCRRFPGDTQKNPATEGFVLWSWPCFVCKVRLDSLQHPHIINSILWIQTGILQLKHLCEEYIPSKVFNYINTACSAVPQLIHITEPIWLYTGNARYVCVYRTDQQENANVTVRTVTYTSQSEAKSIYKRYHTKQERA